MQWILFYIAIGNFAFAFFPTIEGAIQSETPLGAVDFYVEIYEESGNCKLYEETFADVDLLSTNGRFALKLGQGDTRSNHVDNSAELGANVFGSGVPVGCSEIVTSSTKRIIKLGYDDGTFYPITPDIVLGGSPYSMVAQTLDGKTGQDLIDEAQAEIAGFPAPLAVSGTDDGKLIGFDGSQWVMVSPAAIGAGSVGNTEISDVDISKVTGLGTMASEAAGDYVTAADLAMSGSSSVDFGNLTNVPSGLADGDNDTTALSSMTGDSDDIAEGSSNLYMTTSERDKLTNIEANATADMTAGEILTALSGVDGATSGLDADQLDGSDSSYYLDYSNFTNTPVIPSSIGDLSVGIDDSADALAMTIDSDENIGIGTSSPEQKLHVSGGNIRADQLCIGTDCRSSWPSGGGGDFLANGSVSASGDFNMNGNTLTNLAAPSLPGDAATKGYIDTNFYTQSNMQTSGQAQLHFDNLTNLPAGLADGDDDTTALSAMSGNSDNISQGSTNLFMTTAERDKLTNIEPGAAADMTAGEILTALSGVDGSTSGLDADLLDGADSAYYLDYSNFTNTPAIPSSIGELTVGSDSISGNAIDGGTISNFRSTGITDDASATAMTIDASGQIGIGTASPTTALEVFGGIRIGNIAGGATECDEAGEAGRIRYNGGVLEYCDGSAWQTLGTASGGEVNDGSSIGAAGVPVFLGKNGVDLEFANINAGSNMITISSNGTDDTVDIDLSPGDIDIGTLQNAGSMANADTSDYYTQSDMQSSGSASLHYDNITNLPADLADGDDDTTALSAMSGSSDDIGQGSTNLFMTTAERDKLTNIEADAAADMTAGEILTALSGVDGSTSGLDADVLDGADSAHYLEYSNFTNTPVIPSSIGDLSVGIDDNADALAMTIDSAENIGIGTSTPNQKLHVSGNIQADQLCIDADCRAAWPTSGVTDFAALTNIPTGLGDGDDDTTYVNATTSAAGLMSSGDKTKLNSIADGAQPDMTGAEIIAALLPVDGAGTNIDADLLDNQHGAFYLDYANFTNTPTNISEFSAGITDTSTGPIFHVTDSGVGIGTSTPGIGLHILDRDVVFERTATSGQQGLTVRAPTNVKTGLFFQEGFSTKFEIVKEGANLNFSYNDTGMVVGMVMKSDGRVGIGDTSPDASAILDMSGVNNKGAALPNLTTTQRDNIGTPTEGLVIYNTTQGAINVRDSSAWRKLVDDSSPVLCVMRRNSNLSVSGSLDTILFDVEDERLIATSSECNEGSGSFTVPRSGLYEIELSLNVTEESYSSDLDARIRVDTNSVSFRQWDARYQRAVSFRKVQYLTKNQVVDSAIQQTGGTGTPQLQSHSYLLIREIK